MLFGLIAHDVYITKGLEHQEEEHWLGLFKKESLWCDETRQYIFIWYHTDVYVYMYSRGIQSYFVSNLKRKRGKG